MNRRQTAVWYGLPPPDDLAEAAKHFRRLAVCLTEDALPPITGRPDWAERWHTLTACIQFSAVNLLADFFPNCDLWLLPPAALPHLADYFSDGMVWQTEAPPPVSAAPAKPWFALPPHTPPEHVAVIGAGIAGAATAYALARRGVRVSVLEADGEAGAASGNRQGLLYAKISAHPTEQTELLLGGYGFTRRLLETLLPDADTWQPCGVMHLNHNAAEAKRNAALAAQNRHRHLYRKARAAETAALAAFLPSENEAEVEFLRSKNEAEAGFRQGKNEMPETSPHTQLSRDALFWPQGVWLHPPALVRALLDHPLITLHRRRPLLAAERQNGQWLLDTPQGRLKADHIVYCTGADSPKQPHLAALPWHLIRGQTSLAAASDLSAKLQTALSGASYISPAWQGLHCFGATFRPQDGSREWRAEDDEHNRRELADLAPALEASLGITQRGHTAVRCDSPDHLPVVGPLGDAAAMRRVYAKLASDKNYRLDSPCPYLPNVWANSAHGSRGLATAPWCAEALAADICGEANPLSPRLRAALHPNRHIIRALVRQEISSAK